MPLHSFYRNLEFSQTQSGLGLPSEIKPPGISWQITARERLPTVPGQEKCPQGSLSGWARPQPWQDQIIPSQLTDVAKMEELQGPFKRNWAIGIYGSA